LPSVLAPLSPVLRIGFAVKKILIWTCQFSNAVLDKEGEG
jgi:hypothetical protein